MKRGMGVPSPPPTIKRTVAFILAMRVITMTDFDMLRESSKGGIQAALYRKGGQLISYTTSNSSLTFFRFGCEESKGKYQGARSAQITSFRRCSTDVNGSYDSIRSNSFFRENGLNFQWITSSYRNIIGSNVKISAQNRISAQNIMIQHLIRANREPDNSNDIVWKYQFPLNKTFFLKEVEWSNAITRGRNYSLNDR
mmetsp:Transcript_17326/g.47706  ORF Transcript_17326/g.47706 Transcript_17326/m.47706 type:complete len:197 (-) Transcript_17326:329-919(-)